MSSTEHDHGRDGDQQQAGQKRQETRAQDPDAIERVQRGPFLGEKLP